MLPYHRITDQLVTETTTTDRPLAELSPATSTTTLGYLLRSIMAVHTGERFPSFRLTARNLPIMRDRRTLGELDFVYYCQHRQRHVHLETAVKFYLGVPAAHKLQWTAQQQPALSWSQWLGPGCKDRLDLKLLKMLRSANTT